MVGQRLLFALGEGGLHVGGNVLAILRELGLNRAFGRIAEHPAYRNSHDDHPSSFILPRGTPAARRAQTPEGAVLRRSAPPNARPLRQDFI